jgi:hypothetical protein
MAPGVGADVDQLPYTANQVFRHVEPIAPATQSMMTSKVRNFFSVSLNAELC